MEFQVVRCRREIRKAGGGAGWAGSFRFLHDFDFLVGQAVDVIHQPVNLRVRDGDLAFKRGFLLRRLGSGHTFVQFYYMVDERHHLIVMIFPR